MILSIVRLLAAVILAFLAGKLISKLKLLGVPATRMEAVSFGKEKPLAKGSNEEAWAKNRRADIRYR